MYKIIAITLLCVSFLFKSFLQFREYKARNRPIPEELNDVYDEETYLKWKRYRAEGLKLEIVFSIIDFAVIIALIASDAFALMFKSLENPYLGALAVLGVYIGISTPIEFIHTYIDTMKIEQKYGFNKSSLGTFIADEIKSFIISNALILGLLSLFILIYESIGDYILLLFTGILFVLIAVIGFLYPLFSKIFNKFVPLEDGELKDSLTALLDKNGYHVKEIKVMDASRRTTRSNAYFAGFGKTKTIVLYDNLLKTMDNEEILAIFAHELGHGLHKDTIRRAPLSFLSIAIIVILAWLMAKFPSIYNDFGWNGINYGFGLLLLLSAVMPFVSTFIGLFESIFSRKQEYQADEHAVKEGYGEALIRGLKKLFREDLGDLNPDPLVVLLSYSHPTLLQRARHVKEFEKTLEENKEKEN